MPADEGDALHDAALAAARPCPAHRSSRSAAYCGRSTSGCGGGARRRDRRVRRRPSPRFGGEPGRVGAPRPDGRRPPHRPDGHAAVLPADRSTTPVSRRSSSPSSGRSPVVAAHWPTRRRRSCSSTAVTACSRRVDDYEGGPRTSRSVARWRSTTSSPTRPTAAGRPTSRSTCPRWRAAGSRGRRHRLAARRCAASCEPRRLGRALHLGELGGDRRRGRARAAPGRPGGSCRWSRSARAHRPRHRTRRIASRACATPTACRARRAAGSAAGLDRQAERPVLERARARRSPNGCPPGRSSPTPGSSSRSAHSAMAAATLSESSAARARCRPRMRIIQPTPGSA